MFDEQSGSGGQRNVLGGVVQSCSQDPMTGFYRDGCCHTGPHDHGRHTVCVVLTEAFLSYSKGVGNDLSTPRPEYRFAGLVPGNSWCLCASRFVQAADAGCAPRVRLMSTHEATLNFISLDRLMVFAAPTSS